MKSPICSFDAKTGTLCSNCESKLESGHLSSSDVEAAIKLTRLAERNQDINKFTLLGAVKLESDFILMLRNSDLAIIRGDSTIAKKIQQEFNTNVWFVEAETSDRRFIENLFFPSKILNVNLFWLPDGNKLTRVIISGKAGIPKSKDQTAQIQKIAKAVRNIDLLIEYEQK